LSEKQISLTKSSTPPSWLFRQKKNYFQNLLILFFVKENFKNGVYPKVSGLATWSENCKWYS
jgi:hypothetical protein